MNLALQNLIRDRAGINPETLGSNALTAAINAGMHAAKCDDPDSYARLVSQDRSAFQQLIDSLVVSETWFFRGKEATDFACDHGRKLMMEHAKDRPLRILSLACSTGEEPYSLVITLNERGFLPSSYRVVAIDLSLANLTAARLGSYSDFSFRQISQAHKSQYFRAANNRWELSSDIRDRVEFRAGNLIDPQLLLSEAPFDIIFCRNVLIYFTPAARQIALANIIRLLAPGGLLALGHAESSELTDASWQRVGPDGASVFCRRTAPISRESRDIAVVSPPSSFSTNPTTQTTRLALPVAPVDRPTDCWNEIGIRGDRSCPELLKVGHCHNCPVFAAAGRRFLDGPVPVGYQDEWTARLAAPVVEMGSIGETALIFRLAEEWLALSVSAIVEVTMPRTMHRIPHRGGLLEGLINIRGELHLCVRVDELLGLHRDSPQASSDKTRLVVIGKGDDCWAFLADEVDRVRRFPAAAHSPIPATVGRAVHRFTRGVLTASNRSAGLLDSARLFEALRTKVR